MGPWPTAWWAVGPPYRQAQTGCSRCATREKKRRFAAALGDDHTHRSPLQRARLERRGGAPLEVRREPRAKRGIEHHRIHAVSRARSEASATPTRISATPAKWYQTGYSPRNNAARPTAMAGIRCMVAPARAAPMRFTT